VNYIELFSGLGGMGHGLMQAGMNCVGYCEIDKFAHQAFKILHDPEERMWEAYDVRSVTDDDIRLLGRERGPIDLIAGGFPCQAFSIAGKRKGFQDSTRGTLFFEIIRFASILKPKYLLLENVTGLLNHDEGRTFETVIRTLDELGYVGEWCVLNSSAYVPQNRERVFIVASLGGTGGRKVFPFGDKNENAVRSVGNTNPSGNGMNGQVFDAAGLSPTLTTNKGEGNKVLVRAVISPDYATKTMNGRRIKEPEEPMFALTVQDRHGVAILQRPRGNNKGGLHEIAPTLTSNSYQDNNHLVQGYRIRKLTPLECFRLQSFPDEWYHKLKEHGISDSQLYKMAGNAVTSRVAYEIAKRLLA
jgi:DNA (cytosine-5)-methyltransferase 1